MSCTYESIDAHLGLFTIVVRGILAAETSPIQDSGRSGSPKRSDMVPPDRIAGHRSDEIDPTCPLT